MNRSRRASLLAVLLLTVGTVMPVVAQAPVQYVYDELGRLIAVIDTNGDSATYTYDAVGNVVSIARHASSQVSIISFNPSKGPVGTAVHIFGTGFSATAAQNTVTFNGTSATVSAATTTELTVTVPSGATTGTIAVTAPGGSATSSTSFTVAANQAPTITSFSPTAATASTAFTISGTNFQTPAGNNRATLNATPLTLTAATSTQLDSSVPASTTSGHLTVATMYGTATSTGDLYVAPPGYTTGNLEVKARAAGFGASNAYTATLTSSSNVGLVLFDGAPNQKVSVSLSSVTMSNVIVSMLSPFGATLGSANVVSSSTGFLDTVALPPSGPFTYTLLVKPVSGATGNVTLTLNDIVDVTNSITPGGSSVSASITTAGQNARYTFSGTAGHAVSISISSNTISQSYISILKPDGTALLAPTFTVSGSSFIDAVTLPVTGTYTVLVDPIGTNTGSITLTLNDATEQTGTIPTDGTNTNATTSVPGQNVRLTFSGTAGHRMSLKASGSTWANVSLRGTDGTTVLGSTSVFFSTGFIEPVTLATTGTYTVYVDYVTTNTGTVTLNLYDVPSDLSGTIPTDGSSLNVTVNTPGQNAAYTFTGTAAHRMSVKASGSLSASVALLGTDGSTVLGSVSVFFSTGLIEPVTLSSSGTYTVRVDFSGASTGTVTVNLYDVPADLTGTITPGGSSVTANLNTPGQNAVYTVATPTNSRVSLAVGAGPTGTVTVKQSGGSTVASTSIPVALTNFIEPWTFASGQTVTIDLLTFNTGSVTIAAYDVPADTSGTVTIGGSSVGVTTTAPGQNGTLTFSGTASQQVTVHVTGNTASNLTVKLLDTNGTTVLASSGSSSSSFNLSTVTLSSTGTYTVLVDPPGTATVSVNISVTSP